MKIGKPEIKREINIRNKNDFIYLSLNQNPTNQLSKCLIIKDHNI